MIAARQGMNRLFQITRLCIEVLAAVRQRAFNLLLEFPIKLQPNLKIRCFAAQWGEG